MTRPETYAAQMKERGYSAAKANNESGKPKTNPNTAVFDERNLKAWIDG